ncbi:hypothetical protein NEOLEDRAFT_1141598 [Neolentinus lepideus HHB14362 ss-1]|uniref:Uncharacterized protein n=1 Tax=Neolentinus lepideus HHB14362 ss-1 TaxID=1314782 RepID=A0A165NJK8_9AGAM|nr:hypothetical protein NEOLEDRAFT_1141598 [Neolentinus lepideus HHB14362 ss-1]
MAGISPTFLAVFLALGKYKQKPETQSAIYAQKSFDLQFADVAGHNTSVIPVEEGTKESPFSRSPRRHYRSLSV